MSVIISLKYTPNPDSIRFFVEKTWSSFLWECKEESQAFQSPLTQELWKLDGIGYALVGSNFIVINKSKDSSWDLLIPKITRIISKFVEKHENIFPVAKELVDEIIEKASYKRKKEALSEIQQQIWDLLEEKIQPALDLHGGGVEYLSFEQGVLNLRFTGACAGCPSSSATLEYGIKQVLQYYFPEIEKIQMF